MLAIGVLIAGYWFIYVLFCSYDLVRVLHSKVEVAVGGLIKDKLEGHGSTGSGSSVGEEHQRATQVTQDVLQSKQLSFLINVHERA